MNSVLARRPEQIRLEKKLKIIWKDGGESEISYYKLRCDCPCATCIDEFSGEKILDESQVQLNIYPIKQVFIPFIH